MTPEEARLALEAARKAGHVGRLAWDKLCLYYQTEAIVVLVCIVWAHLLLTAALVFLVRQQWWRDYTQQERAQSICSGVITKWSILGVTVATVWLTAAIQSYQLLPKTVAVVAVPEMRAAMAVAAFTRGQAVP